jgi:uncharacterized Rmd1/YagE family protein
MKCACYCTSSSYQLKKLIAFFKGKYPTTNYRDAVYIKNEGDIFYFSYGCIIFWNVSEVVEQDMLKQIKDFEQEPLTTPSYEVFNYVVSETTSVSPEKDLIMIETTNPLMMLAISYALAQSIKLVNYEDAVDRTIKRTEHIPQELATKGKISLSHNAISKHMGQLFLVRSSINLSIDFLGTAEFFWENPNFEPYYLKAATYLEIQKRVEVLNKRLDVIHNLFDMLTNELHHQHSSNLEMIIIFLIALEIFIVLIEYLSK